MEQRKETILNTIIKEHIKTGVPVGSGVLVEKYKLDISPATVRNEMAELEEEGYIMQPHTSAGRIPTELAYNLYIENLKEKKISSAEEEFFCKVISGDDEFQFKQIAKALAELSGKAVFWAVHRHNLYYTGVSNLFEQPEFSQLNIVRDLSQIIDRMDDIIDSVFEDLQYGTNILIGSKNPFGNFCGSIIVKYKNGNKTGVFGLLGPMRMDYQHDLALMNYVMQQLSIKYK